MSRYAALALLTVVLAACQDGAPTSPVAPTVTAPVAAPSADYVPGRYLVMYRDADATPSATTTARMSLAPNDSRVRALVAQSHGRVTAAFNNLVSGFEAELTDSAVAVLRADPSVATVEPEPVVHLESATQSNAPWSLDRIDQTALPLNHTYTYPNAGNGVWVYMIDTGIYTSHVDFGGRAQTGFDATQAGGNAQDCMGHGTETASVVGGTNMGVAKAVQLFAVKVYDCAGASSGTWLVNAMNYVLAQKQAHPSQPMIANMSLNSIPGAMLDTALVRLVRAGVVVTGAAGNSAIDACSKWPAAVRVIISAGAIDTWDTYWPSSNYGRCVDIFAPGVNVPIDYGPLAVTGATSGTSAAAPMVAGVAAMYLSKYPTATPAQVKAAILANAVAGSIKSLPSGSANLLLNGSFVTNAPPPSTTTPPTTPPPTTPPPTTTTVARSLIYATGGIGAPSWSIKVGQTARFAALAYTAANVSVSLTGHTVRFSTTTPTLVSIDAVTGVMQALAPGSFHVTATVDGIAGMSGTMIVTP